MNTNTFRIYNPAIINEQSAGKAVPHFIVFNVLAVRTIKNEIDKIIVIAIPHTVLIPIILPNDDV